MSFEQIQKAKRLYFLLSFALCAVGLVFMIYPAFSLKVVSIVLGLILIANGAVKVYAFFKREEHLLFTKIDLVAGAVMAVLGIMLLFSVFQIATFIGIILAISLFVDGGAKVKIAIECKRAYAYDYWWLNLIFGILTLILAIALIANLSLGGHIIAVIVGASLFMSGLSNLFTTISVHHLT